MTPTYRDLDVVLLGATGFVGRLVAEHLASSAPPSARIGLAGRSPERLAALRLSLGPAAVDWPLLTTDSTDPASVAQLAAATRVVATTVGPYSRYGLPLVQACARAGTSTADLTGEVLFVRRCIDAAHEVAAASGARIVNACGFDSVPSDLGVLLAADRAHADGQGGLLDTTLVVRSARGGISGGTVDSLRGQLDEIRGDRALRAVAADPYALSPDRAAEPEPAPAGGRPAIGRDAELGGWYAPFVMGPFNTRVVRRSNALSGWSYGRRFRYREVVGFGRSPLAPVLAAGMTAALGAAVAGLRARPTRAVLDRVLPAPGEGPSERTRRRGRFLVEVHARAQGGARYVSVVGAQGDPGYAATSVMLGQSALSLAFDDLPPRAGVLTPATAMGPALVARLRAAGFRLEVERVA